MWVWDIEVMPQLSKKNISKKMLIFPPRKWTHAFHSKKNKRFWFCYSFYSIFVISVVSQVFKVMQILPTFDFMWNKLHQKCKKLNNWTLWWAGQLSRSSHLLEADRSDLHNIYTPLTLHMVTVVLDQEGLEQWMNNTPKRLFTWNHIFSTCSNPFHLAWIR